MYSKVFKLSLIASFSVFIFMIVDAQEKSNGRKKGTPEDCVPNEKKAIEIAESNWLRAFGSSIYKRKPFTTTLKDSTIWIVQGTLNTKKGGVPYIEIQKKDCKILKISHGK